MRIRADRELITGAALIIVGLAVMIYSLRTYPVGRLTLMGPGMFPAALGGLLSVLGCIIVIPSLFRRPQYPEVDPWQLLVILSAIVAFGLLIGFVGLIPSVIVVTLMTVLADGRMSLLGTVLLSIGLAAATYLLFAVVLGVHFTAYRWPL